MEIAEKLEEEVEKVNFGRSLPPLWLLVVNFQGSFFHITSQNVCFMKLSFNDSKTRDVQHQQKFLYSSTVWLLCFVVKDFTTFATLDASIALLFRVVYFGIFHSVAKTDSRQPNSYFAMISFFISAAVLSIFLSTLVLLSLIFFGAIWC